MSPRSKSFDVNDALSRAVDVFWEQGYEGASMQDLLERMGISRQSLYDTFGDKRRLFLSSLQYYMDEYASMVYSELEAPGASMDAIRNFAQHAIESADSQVAHRACLMVNTVMEFGRKDEDVAAMVQAHQRRTVAAYANALTGAKAAGQIDADADIESLALFMTANGLGTLVMLKSGASAEDIRRQLGTALSFIERTE